MPIRRRFGKLIEDVIALVERSPDAGRPVPPDGPPLRWPPSGIELEVRAMRGGSLLKRRAFVLANTLFVYVIMRFGISVGGFVPKTYVRQVVENSDFRKYDDGLRMILDCTPELESALTKRSGRGGFGGNRALRPAPAGRGDDDLLHALGAAQRPRPFHRRRARRLRLGGISAESDGGVKVCLFGSGGLILRDARKYALLRTRFGTLMVRSAATPRVSNQRPGMCDPDDTRREIRCFTGTPDRSPRVRARATAAGARSIRRGG